MVKLKLGKNSEEMEIKSWDDFKDKYFKLMLTPQLAKKLKLPLIKERGVWWVEVNKDKKETQTS